MGACLILNVIGSAVVPEGLCRCRESADPGVAAPWVKARETMNSYVVVRRTPTDHYPRALFRAYPLAPFGPRYPLTYSWECGEGIPAYAAGGLILRPFLS